MLISLLSILSCDGKEEHITAPVEMEKFINHGESFEIQKKSSVEFSFVNKGDKQIVFSGKGDMVILIPCARCLEAVPVPFHMNFSYELDMKESEEERSRNLDEQNYLSGTDIDVDKLVYDEILVNWPIRVLCKEDCQGICSHCGGNLNKVKCDCDTKELDPRMAAIRDIFSKFKEV